MVIGCTVNGMFDRSEGGKVVRLWHLTTPEKGRTGKAEGKEPGGHPVSKRHTNLTCLEEIHKQGEVGGKRMDPKSSDGPR